MFSFCSALGQSTVGRQQVFYEHRVRDVTVGHTRDSTSPLRPSTQTAPIEVNDESVSPISGWAGGVIGIRRAEASAIGRNSATGVAGELRIAAPDHRTAGLHLHRAFPVEQSGAGPSVEFLRSHDRAQAQVEPGLRHA